MGEVVAGTGLELGLLRAVSPPDYLGFLGIVLSRTLQHLAAGARTGRGAAPPGDEGRYGGIAGGPLKKGEGLRAGPAG